MKKDLAEKLLAKIMGWTDAQKATQRARLESFASYKYDEYQQFSPGRRFIESLALWLVQFDPGKERETAYDFVCNRLIFISMGEMNHLVELSFPTIIRPLLIAATAIELDISPDRVKAVVATREYRMRLRRTLVLGMSDGARTDWFRRANPHDMSNEQVFHAYDVSEAKAGNMIEKLKSALCEILQREPEDEEARFENVILLDDFSASGTSAIRRNDEGVWDGKIPKIVEMLEAADGLGSAIADSGVTLIIVVYVASEQAMSYTQKLLADLAFSKGSIVFEVVHRLGSQTPLDDIDDDPILALAKQDRYFDPVVDDRHAAVGKKSKRLGFAEGRLPVVLGHNTPNNSIFLLWAHDETSVRGLFPRVDRHRKLQ